MRIDAILMGERARKDMGDIGALADSIAEHGLLHPVVVTMDNRLICGARRLEACRLLGWDEIPTRAMDIDDLLSAERDENTMRKDFLPSEAVAVGLLIESRLRRPLSERAKKGWETRRRKASGDEDANFASSKSPTVRDAAAKAVGMSHATYQHAREIVRAAEDDPEVFGDLPAQMDTIGSVYPVHKEMKRRRNGAASAIIPRTKTRKINRKASERARHAIGVIVSISSEFDAFTLGDVSPTDEERTVWLRELAAVVSSINRFRRELKKGQS